MYDVLPLHQLMFPKGNHFAGRAGTGTMQIRKICLTAAMVAIVVSIAAAISFLVCISPPRDEVEAFDYFDYKEKYESRIADLAVEMEQLEDGLRTMDTQIEQHRALEQDAAQIKTDRALTGALIERLIDRIEVSHDKQITVRYRFQSEFETYAEVLEQCRNM